MLSGVLFISELSVTDSDNPKGDRFISYSLALALFPEGCLPSLPKSNALCIDTFDLIEAFDSVEVVEVSLDLPVHIEPEEIWRL